MNTHVVTVHVPAKLASQLDEFALRIDRPKGGLSNKRWLHGLQ